MTEKHNISWENMVKSMVSYRFSRSRQPIDWKFPGPECHSATPSHVSPLAPSAPVSFAWPHLCLPRQTWTPRAVEKHVREILNGKTY